MYIWNYKKNKKLVNNKKIVFFLEFPLVLFIGMICTTCFLILFFFYKNYWYMMFVIWLAWFCKRFILFGNSWYHGWKYNFIFVPVVLYYVCMILVVFSYAQCIQCENLVFWSKKSQTSIRVTSMLWLKPTLSQNLGTQIITLKKERRAKHL